MSFASPKRDAVRLAVNLDAQWLCYAQAESGGWGPKNLNRGQGETDFADTVWAIRALNAAAYSVGCVPDSMWQGALAALYKMQNKDGSWDDPGGKSIGSSLAATAAAVECLTILGSNLFL